MAILFLLVCLGTGAAWRYAYCRRDELRVDWAEAGLLALSVEILFVLSVVPLVWLNRWSIPIHLTAILILGLPAYWRLGRRLWFRPILFRFEIPLRELMVFSGCFAVGTVFQWDSINYLFPTHDSGVYLDAAHNLSTNGSFLFVDQTAALMPGLQGLLGGTLGFESFGLYPHPSGTAFRSFHGMFAAPVWYAFGLSLLGAEHALKVNWFHLFCSLLLLFAILRNMNISWIWSSVAAFLFVVCPLVAPLYREPLSEPLAQVFFLGMVLVSVMNVKRTFTEWRWWLLVCVMAALTARATGLMYVPFFALACGLGRADETGDKPAWLFWGASFLGLGVLGATVCHLSPHYITGLVSSVVDRVALRVTGAHWQLPYSWIIPALLPFLALLLSALGVRLKRLPRRYFNVRYWGGLYFTLLLIGLGLRYGKTFFYFSETIGGFPFVQFNLDSVLFYIGPLVAPLAVYTWAKLLARWPISEGFFLQGYLPFCLFFYLVYYFGPFPLQVYLQRCFLTEFVPLAVIGATVGFAAFYRDRWAPAVRLALVFSVVWSVGILTLINHRDVAAGTSVAYERTVADLTAGRNGKPILVAGTNDWRELSFVVPLSSGFGFPLLFAGDQTAEKNERLNSYLTRQGYEPVWVSAAAPAEALSVAQLKHCVKYPHFALSAPPIELGTHCADLEFYQLGEETRLTRSR